MGKMKTTIPVLDINGQKTKEVDLPDVFSVAVRPEVIGFVHKNVALNKRQPYAVSPDAGKNYSARSWGTGRALARVPRVKGAGTKIAGQAAFANFCRGGHMASPTTVLRRWQRKTSLGMRRYATAMGVAASASVPFLMSKGHRIEDIENIPLVVNNDIEELKKTKEAKEFLNKIGLKDEINKVKDN